MDKIKPYLKAFFAFITPGAVLLGSAVLSDSPAGEVISQGEWIRALVACVVTSGAVFIVPNKDPEGTHQDESVQPDDDGEADLDDEVDPDDVDPDEFDLPTGGDPGNVTGTDTRMVDPALRDL